MLKNPLPLWVARVRRALRPAPRPVVPHTHYCVVEDRHWQCLAADCVKHLVAPCGLPHRWRNARLPATPPVKKSWLRQPPPGPPAA